MNPINFKIFLRQSLKTRVTLLALIIFLISIWSLAFYANKTLRLGLQDMVSDQQFSTASFVAKQITEELEIRLQSLENIASSVSPDMLENTGALQTHLESRATFQGLFNAGTFITGIDGVAIASIPISAGRIGVSYMERDHIFAALKEGKTKISKPLIGKVLMAPAFGMATPIHDADGKVIGALVGAIDLSKPNFLDKITQNNYAKTGGYVLIAPQHKLIITGTDKSYIMKPTPAPGINPLFDRYVQGFEGSGIVVDSHGVEVLLSAKQIPAAGWILVVRIPATEAFSPIHTTQQRMILIAIFVTLLAGGLTRWILSRQLAPMLVAARILDTQSDTDQPMKPLPITHPDEIGKLIGGFNHLLQTLTQREEVLQENRQRLADIVRFLPDATIAINQERRVIIWNKALEEMTGTPASDMIGKGDYAYAIPFYGKAQPQLMDLILEDQEDITALYPTLNREGDNPHCRDFFSHPF